MKTITINVSEPIYKDFQRFAKERDRTTSELIRESMELYRELRMVKRPSLLDTRPVSVGKLKRAPFEASDDLLGEMLDD